MPTRTPMHREAKNPHAKRESRLLRFPFCVLFPSSGLWVVTSRIPVPYSDALDFLDLRSTTLQRTQVVQLGATHLAVTDDGDAAQTGRMHMVKVVRRAKLYYLRSLQAKA